MLDLLSQVPYIFQNFWNANLEGKVTIFLIGAFLFFMGYGISKLLINRNIGKWILFFMGGLPLLMIIYQSNNIFFIGLVALGFIRGLWQGSPSMNPLGAFEGLVDFFYSVKTRRNVAEAEYYAEQAKSTYEQASRYQEHVHRSQAEAQYSQYESEAEAEARFKENMRRTRGQKAQPKEKSKPFTENQSEGQQERTSSRSEEEPRERPSNKTEDTRTPEEVLNLQPGYDLSELKKARTNALRHCHPDVLVGRPQWIKDAMEEEAKRINQSFDILKKRL